MLICLFQFTLPCGERLSISFNSSLYILFQFTLPCGERQSFFLNSVKGVYFNSRSRAGSDIPLFSCYIALKSISIHAPVRGATLDSKHNLFLSRNFNSRSRAGSDLFLLKYIRLYPWFQFTLPCGERQVHPVLPSAVSDFNSHSRAGSDGYGSVIKLSGKNFNSRSRAGSDNISIFISPYFYSFQFTLPCGERRSHDWGYWNNSFISIHAPVRGATPSLYNDIENEIISIHAPVRGATNSTKLLSGFSPFQFTLPCGERQQLLSVKMKN